MSVALTVKMRASLSLHIWCTYKLGVEGRRPVEQLGGGVVKAVGGADLAVLGAAHVHLAAHLAGQHLAQLHSPLVERVDAPDEALHMRAGFAHVAVLKVQLQQW